MAALFYFFGPRSGGGRAATTAEVLSIVEAVRSSQGNIFVVPPEVTRENPVLSATEPVTLLVDRTLEICPGRPQDGHRCDPMEYADNLLETWNPNSAPLFARRELVRLSSHPALIVCGASTVVHCIDESKFKAATNKGGSWGEFAAQHGYCCILRIANPVVLVRSGHAIIYTVDDHEGTIFYLRKSGGTWTVENKEVLWVAN